MIRPGYTIPTETDGTPADYSAIEAAVNALAKMRSGKLAGRRLRERNMRCMNTGSATAADC